MNPHVPLHLAPRAAIAERAITPEVRACQLRTIRGVLGSSLDEEDLLQIAQLGLYRRLARAPVDSVIAMAIVIARCVARTHLRTLRRERRRRARFARLARRLRARTLRFGSPVERTLEASSLLGAIQAELQRRHDAALRPWADILRARIAGCRWNEIAHRVPGLTSAALRKACSRAANAARTAQDCRAPGAAIGGAPAPSSN